MLQMRVICLQKTWYRVSDPIKILVTDYFVRILFTYCITRNGEILNTYRLFLSGSTMESRSLLFILWIPYLVFVLSCQHCFSFGGWIGPIGQLRLASLQKRRPCVAYHSRSTACSNRSVATKTWYLCLGKLGQPSVFSQSRWYIPRIGSHMCHPGARMPQLCNKNTNSY